jgi:hypothetical protein
MAAAAHDIGRAEYDRVAARRCFARGCLVHRKFGNRDTLCAKRPSLLRRFVIMREHPHAALARDRCQTRDRSGNLVGAGQLALHLVLERLVRESRAFDHCGALPGLVSQRRGDVHVIVERE